MIDLSHEPNLISQDYHTLKDKTISLLLTNFFSQVKFTQKNQCNLSVEEIFLEKEKEKI